MQEERPQAENKKLRRSFKPKNKRQVQYIEMMKEEDITLCIGPAGSGKTSCAMAVAADKLMKGEVSKIVITRPTVETGKGLGSLPGDINEKYGPYVRPVIEELKTYFGKDTVERYIQDETFLFMPLEYVRGMTFKYSFVILDEAQNTTIEQLRMFLTRIGNGSTMVINGDVEQNDMRKGESGFEDVYHRLDGLKGVGIHEFMPEDIVRHELVGHILDMLGGMV